MTVGNRHIRRKEAALARSGVNKARGEVTLQLGEKSYALCATMGALAEIEDALEVESIAEIAEKLENASTKNIAIVLRALMIDEDAPSVAEIRQSGIELPVAIKAISDAFNAMAPGAKKNEAAGAEVKN